MEAAKVKAVGTCIVPYCKYPEPPSGVTASEDMCNISAMPVYARSSPEELRLQDYAANVRNCHAAVFVFTAPASKQPQGITGGGFDALLSGPGFLSFSSQNSTSNPATSMASTTSRSGFSFGPPSSAITSGPGFGFGAPISSSSASSCSPPISSSASFVPSFGSISSSASLVPSFGAPISSSGASFVPSSGAPLSNSSSASLVPSFGAPNSSSGAKYLQSFGASIRSDSARSVPSFCASINSNNAGFGVSSGAASSSTSTGPQVGFGASGKSNNDGSLSGSGALRNSNSASPVRSFGAPNSSSDSSFVPGFGALGNSNSASPVASFDAPINSNNAGFGVSFGPPSSSTSTHTCFGKEKDPDHGGKLPQPGQHSNFMGKLFGAHDSATSASSASGGAGGQVTHQAHASVKGDGHMQDGNGAPAALHGSGVGPGLPMGASSSSGDSMV